MIQGHAKIELRNVTTNEVTEIEGNNLVTNWASDLVATNYVNMPNPKAQYIPLYNTLFNGIACFQNVLPTDKYTFPSNNPLIGHAGSLTESTTQRGVPNNAESGFVTDTNGKRIGYRYVWDFPTNTANGVISAIGLTTQHAGNYGAGATNRDYLMNLIGNWGSTERVPHTWFEPQNNFMYSVTLTSTTTVSIRKYRMCLTNIGLMESSSTYLLLEESSITLASPFGAPISTASFSIDSQFIYCFGMNNTTTLAILKINRSNMTVVSNTTHTLNNACRVVNGYSRLNAMPYIDGYLYLISQASNNRAYKINVNNTTDMTEIVGTSSGVDNGAKLVLGGNYYGHDSSVINDVLYDGSSLISDDNYSHVLQGGWLITSQSFVVGFFRPNVMLSTIYNIPSPITKTNAQTMKITYTIQKAP